MLRLHATGPRQQKTPAASWQARERVGIELVLSRHADVRGECFLQCARRNNSCPSGWSNATWWCVLRSGRTLGCPSKRVFPGDVWSVDGPCPMRALPCSAFPRPRRRLFPRTAGTVRRRLLTKRRKYVIASDPEPHRSGTNPDATRNSDTVYDSATHHERARGTPRHRPLSLRNWPSRGNFTQLH
jgi:hypothetical protein